MFLMANILTAAVFSVVCGRTWQRVLLLGLLLVNYLSWLVYMAVDTVSGEGVNAAFWFHLGQNVSEGTFEPYMIEYLIRIAPPVSLGLLAAYVVKRFSVSTNYLFGMLSLSFLFSTNSFVHAAINHATRSEDLSRTGESFSNLVSYPLTMPELVDRDLIIISAESLERSIYESEFGEILGLRDLEYPKIDFADIRQVYGTSWTVAGISAMLCGMPLTPSSGNTLGAVNHMHSSATCLSDVLAANGYKSSFVLGASKRFSGKDALFESHGISDICDKDCLLRRIPEAETNAWGVHDEYTLQHVIERASAAESQGEKYAIFVNTLDSHAPDGFPSSRCRDVSSKDFTKMQAAIFCLDSYLQNVVREVVKNDLDRNNLIVIHSDHLMMRRTPNEYIDQVKSERRNLFLIIDPYAPGDPNRLMPVPGSSLDIGATVLGYLSDSVALGAGRDLLSKQVATMVSQYQENVDAVIQQIEPLFLEYGRMQSPEKFTNIERTTGMLAFQNGLKIRAPFIYSIEESRYVFPDVTPDGQFNGDRSFYHGIVNSNKNTAGEQSWIVYDTCAFFDEFVNTVGFTNLNSESCLVKISFIENHAVLTRLENRNDTVLIKTIPKDEFKDKLISSTPGRSFFSTIRDQISMAVPEPIKTNIKWLLSQLQNDRSNKI